MAKLIPRHPMFRVPDDDQHTVHSAAIASRLLGPDTFPTPPRAEGPAQNQNSAPSHAVRGWRAVVSEGGLEPPRPCGH